MISIVSGTYNRLNYLKIMINSARKSMCKGLSYEFVIVDGGSRDGTIEWCKDQSDVKLIEHGKLLGAVKAFNDGARAAIGDYVILANDDIEFIDESILVAVAFMQDNPQVGVGCFYQDRYGKEMHVEEMPAVKNGKQISTVYGQVCIVRKWLGDYVGWWGNYLRTYGGDNELSCNVLELGYKVEPIPCACIHDPTPVDELRSINNSYKGTQHPDSAKWIEKWTRNGLLGPIIKDTIEVAGNIEENRLRILYMPIYERGFGAYKRGLLDALSRRGTVIEHDYVNSHYPVDYLFDLMNAWNPCVAILQIQDWHTFTAYNIFELKREHPDTLFILWNGDYHPEHLYNKNYMDMLSHFDLCGFVTTDVKAKYDAAGIKWRYWQIGYEPTRFYANNRTYRYDVIFQANGYSDARMALAGALRKIYNNKFGLYGFWPRQFKAKGSTLYNFEAGAELYGASKMAISDSQWPHAAGFVSNRLFQAMIAGPLVLQQRFDGMTELLGLKDGEHLVVWDNINDLTEKIRYYSVHDKERLSIAENGRLFVVDNHSFDRRVQEIFPS